MENVSEEDMEKHVLTKTNGWNISNEGTLCTRVHVRVRGEKRRGEREKSRERRTSRKKSEEQPREAKRNSQTLERKVQQKCVDVEQQPN